MKPASCNIRYGIGLDGRFDLDRIAANVESAEIVAAQEVTRKVVTDGASTWRRG